MPTFPIDEFYSRFPVFENNVEKYPVAEIANAGTEAQMYIGPSICGMPMENPEVRKYALFLMTAHILVLNKPLDESTESGTPSAGGAAFKSTIGSVSVEKTKPNSFTTDDFSYWLNQTEYGRRLLVLLDFHSVPGVFLNTREDSVRDLI